MLRGSPSRAQRRGEPCGRPVRVCPHSGPASRHPRRTPVRVDYTHPVGLGRPATLQAPFAGPLGNSS